MYNCFYIYEIDNHPYFLYKNPSPFGVSFLFHFNYYDLSTNTTFDKNYMYFALNDMIGIEIVHEALTNKASDRIIKENNVRHMCPFTEGNGHVIDNYMYSVVLQNAPVISKIFAQDKTDLYILSPYTFSKIQTVSCIEYIAICREDDLWIHLSKDLYMHVLTDELDNNFFLGKNIYHKQYADLAEYQQTFYKRYEKFFDLMLDQKLL